MSTEKRIAGLYRSAPRMAVDAGTKLVLMSDLHRGAGNGADNFGKNQNLFYSALGHYDREGFTYVELGDGDDLWENKDFAKIAREYDHIFARMAGLYQQGRLVMLYGNHDAIKRRERWVRDNLQHFTDPYTKACRSLFPDIQVLEGLVLQHRTSGGEILLLHGHQADFFNDRLWRLGQFLVRHVWKSLELVGFENPVSTSANPKRRDKVEQKLAAWSAEHGVMVIAGHTHRPIFPPEPGDLYLNDGSGVHPRCVTALELEREQFTPVRWEIHTRTDGALFVARKPASEPIPLAALFAHTKAPVQV